MNTRKALSLIVSFFISVLFIFADPIRFEDVKRKENLPKDRPSVAIVLSGGGAKGFAQLPYMEYIDQLDIPIDMVIGCSVGSIIGGFYCAGYSIQEIIDTFSNMDWTPYFTDTEASPFENVYGVHSKNENLLSINFDNSLSLRLGSAVSNGQLAYQLIKKMLIKYPSNKSFDELPIPYRATATDMLTGDAIVLQDGDLAEAMRASMGLPGVFEPIDIDGRYLVDGGLRYNLPINVAKAMGYDIIIALDISGGVLSDVEAFSSNPAVGLWNALSISEAAATAAIIDQADLVIYPDYKNYGSSDFNRAKELYEAGKSNLDDYKEALEEIRKRIYPEDYDQNGKRISSLKEKNTHGVYNDLKGLHPTEIIYEDALERDIPYIEEAFKKVKADEFTLKDYEKFSNAVYLTGNYTSVRIRLMDEDGKQYIKLITKHKSDKELKVLMSGEIKHSFTNISATTANLNMELQARGYTGPGSMFAIRGTAITDFGLELYYLQPFTANLFLETSLGALNNCYRKITYTLESDPSDIIEFNNTYVNLNFGIRTPNSNLAKLGFFLKAYYSPTKSYGVDPYIRTLENYTNETQSRIYGGYIGGFFNTEFGTLNEKSFATSGWNFSPTVKHVFVIEEHQIIPCLLIGEIDYKFVIPISKKFSLSTSLKAGTDISEETTSYYGLLPFEAFSSYDRYYFPSISAKDHFGTNIGATRVALQFKPKDNLTILGGAAIFLFEGTAGFVNYDWKDAVSMFENPDTEYPIIWSGTFGVGVKGNNNFNTVIKIGACSTYENKVGFLFCLDIGTIKF